MDWFLSSLLPLFTFENMVGLGLCSDFWFSGSLSFLD